jgi:predicted MPP superfamily phosphohydrolase
MSPYLIKLIIRIVLTFGLLQIVAVAGCYLVFRPFKHKTRWALLLGYLLALNSGWFFLFTPFAFSVSVRTLLDYLLLYPFFVYMLICFMLVYFFLAAGTCAVLWWVLKKLKTMLQTVKVTATTPSGRFDTGRRSFVKALSLGIIYPVGGLSAYGMYIGSEQLDISEETLNFPDLPPDLDGLSIVQLTDIHAGAFMNEERMKYFVDIVNDLAPDIVVITGDFINGGNEFVDQTADALAGLRPRLGSFGVLGNHDFYGPEEQLCEKLDKGGVQMLRNRWHPITPTTSSVPLYLAGIDDPQGSWYVNNRFDSLDAALQGIPAGGFTVLLSHRPNIFDESARRRIPLTIAGHTHGGQVIIPNPGGNSLSLARMAYDRYAGLYQQDASYLYVNRGLGVVGPPIRLNCPREITRFVLRSFAVGKKSKGDRQII